MIASLNALMVGLVGGTLIWVATSLLTPVSEPWDTETIWWAGQVLLSALAAGLGFRRGWRAVLAYVTGIYIASVVCPWLFGSKDVRAMMGLAAIMAFSLCILPTFGGSMGVWAGRRFRAKQLR